MEATLTEKLALFLVLIGSLSVHEFAHAWVADKMGDSTPRSQGRLTLNPLVHIDLFGSVIIPLMMILMAPGFAIIGWARPVIIDPRNFKRPVAGDVLTSLAGPFSNFVLATLCAVVFGLVAGALGMAASKAVMLGVNIIALNVLLTIFNLLPVPPLDGSHLMRHLFRMSEMTYMRLAQWGTIILIVLINLEPFRMALWRLVTLLSTPLMMLMDAVAGAVARR